MLLHWLDWPQRIPASAQHTPLLFPLAHALLFLHLNIFEKKNAVHPMPSGLRQKLSFSPHTCTRLAQMKPRKKSSGSPTVLFATVSKIHIFDVLLKIYIHSSALKKKRGGGVQLSEPLPSHIYIKSQSIKRK